MKNRLSKQLTTLITEQQNPNTINIDECSALEIAMFINNEDKKIPLVIETELPNIANAIQLVGTQLKKGGRLIYVGAGTSGRLGILDASECPPTFGVSPTMVQGIIAGGKNAVFRSIEGAEDSPTLAAKELRKLKISSNDVVCGIMASRRTPFVLGALDYAKKNKIKSILVTANPPANKTKLATIEITTIVGAEVIMGSTRMKTGTAHKMVLNMISTGAMILLGKTYGNMMIDLQQTNEKLKERAKRMFMMVTGKNYTEAEIMLKKAKGSLKIAITMEFTGYTYIVAKDELEKQHGFVKKVVGQKYLRM